MTPEDYGIYHVYPLEDSQEHSLNAINPPLGKAYCKCPCKPEHQEQENGSLIIIHNSFDGREGIEWVNEILK
jgi:hypothetical protein